MGAGWINSGHYICFIRRNNTWYKCDDGAVTPASRDDVLRSKG